MNTGLQAVQHIRRMRGGSQSHLLRASDGAFYVTKFQNNPQHVRVLANEMFATRLAQWLGLPVPRIEVIDVSDWLITHTQDLRVEVGGSAVPCSSGKQLGSLHPDLETQVFDCLPESQFSRVANIQDFARVLVLDKWTSNSDGRQVIFSRKTRARHYRATFIDQGHCFNAGEWSFPDSPLRGTYACTEVYSSVTGWEAFEPALSRAERADPIDLRRCAESIPPQWYGYDHDGLEGLVESLYLRRQVIRDLIGAFRKSNRNPFPNWTEQPLPKPLDCAPAVHPHGDM